MRLAFQIAQWVADGFLVGFCLWWLWVRYRRRGSAAGKGEG